VSAATLIGSVVAVLADAAMDAPCDEGAEGIAVGNAMLNRVPPLASHCTDAVNAVHLRKSIMLNSKVPVSADAHQCPSCREPQTKIKRVLDGGKFGSTNFVCSRPDCPLGIDVSKLETWVPA
jgi:hypothetical protein